MTARGLGIDTYGGYARVSAGGGSYAKGCSTDMELCKGLQMPGIDRIERRTYHAPTSFGLPSATEVEPTETLDMSGFC